MTAESVRLTGKSRCLQEKLDAPTYKPDDFFEYRPISEYSSKYAIRHNTLALLEVINIDMSKYTL